MPDERLLVETDAPYLTPQAVRKQPTSPRSWRTPRAFVAELRGVSLQELGATLERNAARVLRLGDEPAPPLASPSSRACGACARFAVRPDRELGQNFLIDSNILGVIDAGRRALGARTWCSRSAAASACSPSISPRASTTCT